MNLKQKNKEGISLIVLVITIIVMIILASSIILSLNGSGIIEKANKAKQDSDSANLREELVVKMAQLEVYNISNLSNDEVKEELDKISNAKVEQISDGAWKVTKGSASYAVYSTGEISDIWDGTSEVPEIKEKEWNIYTCEQFKFFADYINNGRNLTAEQKDMLKQAGYSESDLVLTEDTTLNILSNLDFGARAENGVKVKGENWIPIANGYDTYFKGIVEGNNNTIRGIYVKTTNTHMGIFRLSGPIQNLILKDSYIEGKSNVGGFAGSLEKGKIINCENYATVVATSERAGGICSQIIGGTSLENCKNYGTVEAQGSGDNVAGVVGLAVYESAIRNCYNYGNVTGIIAVGGIVGQSQEVVQGCVNKGTIKGKTYVGGICGNFNGTIEKCYNTGNIIGITENCECIGGIAGENIINSDVALTNCYNAGNIKIEKGSTYGVAGVIGYISNTNTKGTIKNNYTIGTLTFANNTSINLHSVGRVANDSVATFTFANNYCVGTPQTNTSDIQTTLSNMKTNTFLNNLNTGLASPAWEFRKGFNNGYPALIGVK